MKYSKLAQELKSMGWNLKSEIESFHIKEFVNDILLKTNEELDTTVNNFKELAEKNYKEYERVIQKLQQENEQLIAKNQASKVLKMQERILELELDQKATKEREELRERTMVALAEKNAEYAKEIKSLQVNNISNDYMKDYLEKKEKNEKGHLTSDQEHIAELALLLLVKDNEIAALQDYISDQDKKIIEMSSKVSGSVIKDRVGGHVTTIDMPGAEEARRLWAILTNSRIPTPLNQQGDNTQVLTSNNIQKLRELNQSPPNDVDEEYNKRVKELQRLGFNFYLWSDSFRTQKTIIKESVLKSDELKWRKILENTVEYKEHYKLFWEIVELFAADPAFVCWTSKEIFCNSIYDLTKIVIRNSKKANSSEWVKILSDHLPAGLVVKNIEINEQIVRATINYPEKDWNLVVERRIERKGRVAQIKPFATAKKALLALTEQ